MSLATACRSDFNRAVLKDGENYFRQRRVDITRIGRRGLTANVRGFSGNYQVYLNWSEDDGKSLAVACNCPVYDETALCQHIWATILTADSRGLTDALEPPQYGVEEVNPPKSSDIAALIDEAGAPPAGLSSCGAESTPSANTRTKAARRRSKKAPQPKVIDWTQRLQEVQSVNRQREDGRSPLPAAQVPLRGREAWFVFDLTRSAAGGHPIIALFQREQKVNGEYGKLKSLSLEQRTIDTFPLPDDRNSLLRLYACLTRPASAPHSSGYYDYRYSYQSSYKEVTVPVEHAEAVFPPLAATGRFRWMMHASDDLDPESPPLRWDAGEPWKLRLNVASDEESQRWTLTGQLVRNGESIDLTKPVQLFRRGLVLFEDCLARCDVGPHFGWVLQFRKHGPLHVPFVDRDSLLGTLWSLPGLPEIELPENLKAAELRLPPVGKLQVREENSVPKDHFAADVQFVYGPVTIPSKDVSAGVLDAETKQLVVRDPEAERALLRRLADAGVQAREHYQGPRDFCELHRKQLPGIVAALTAEGWIVEAQGKRVRRPGEFKLDLTTNVDWFELDGEFDFEGEVVKLPALLEALQRGDEYVRLGDGSHGLLPAEWLKKYASLAGLGQADEGKLKFHKAQALLLDALLSAQEEDRVTLDRKFIAVREKLRSFAGVAPADPDASFQGELRNYQKQGLGWLHFLREYGFGGCLADDMGLGKTVQVLALLESRRLEQAGKRNGRKPSLVVVPKSLVFNWVEEARRFAPELKVLNYTGLGRSALLEQVATSDVVVTTYATMRLDILKLKEIEFDYAILDESQAVKNANSQAAKACRLLRANHRLAMTGTPVENHLGELWSLFEFLNPGMLGRSATFLSLTKRSGDDDRESLQLLARGLAPFLLRRTKKQVLTELPEKSEQTLWCGLEGKQRKQYDELRDYYRARLTRQIEDEGLAKSKIVVLEALLRLRQAACHPGLIDRAKTKEPSAKFEALLEQIEEVVSEGHKALVFSQFTSLLSLLKGELEERGVVYEYLDGKTRDRQQKVQRFQEDPACPLFLISLKAGGHGLNLTAADYVFILDPWWNPAVEAQAVDRAHRIGQTRPVFAYRLIARNTVEEKILELQKSKRALADAIIGEDNSILKNLTAEDLQLLLT